jgi:hypothetical protein
MAFPDRQVSQRGHKICNSHALGTPLLAGIANRTEPYEIPCKNLLFQTIEAQTNDLRGIEPIIDGRDGATGRAGPAGVARE